MGEYIVGIVVLDEATGLVLPAFSTTAPDDLPAEEAQPLPPPPIDSDDDETLAEEDEPPAEDTESPDLATSEGGSDDLVPAQAPPSGSAPLYMRGEYILPVTLRVVTPAEAITEADADLAHVETLAEQTACEDAWKTWWDARRHVITDKHWLADHEAQAHILRARCHARRAERLEDPTAQAASLVEGLRWGPYDPVLQGPARSLAAEFYAKGLAFREAEDWEQAFVSFQTAVNLDTRLSMARRLAEECRDERLDIAGKGNRNFLDSFIDPKWRNRKPGPKPGAVKPSAAKPIPPGGARKRSDLKKSTVTPLKAPTDNPPDPEPEAGEGAGD